MSLRYLLFMLMAFLGLAIKKVRRGVRSVVSISNRGACLLGADQGGQQARQNGWPGALPTASLVKHHVT
jgi:hypothetical protein